jgi:hypothetical protein
MHGEEASSAPTFISQGVADGFGDRAPRAPGTTSESYRPDFRIAELRHEAVDRSKALPARAGPLDAPI